MLNILESFRSFKYHKLVDQENRLYIVSNDYVNYGISNNSVYFVSKGHDMESDLRVPLKYEILKYYRIDRILAKYKGKYGFVSADLIPYIYDGSRDKSLCYNDYEIVIPFLFDKIEDIGGDLFEVEIDGHIVIMDIEGIIESNEMKKLEEILDSHYKKGTYDPNTGIYIPRCMSHFQMDDHRLCMQTVCGDNDQYVVGRGWQHISDDYGCDYEENALHGVIDNNGKCIIPTIFEQIEMLDGFILAKYRNYFSDREAETHFYVGADGDEYIDEEVGDLFLFTVEGECLLGGFSDIEMVDNDTFHIYLKDYIYHTDGTLDVYNSHSYIILNKEFALKEIANPEQTYKHTYLDDIAAEKNPFHKDLLKRLGLYVTPVPHTITHNDIEREEIDGFYDDDNYIDDPLDAFDGDIDAYNEWRL